MHDLRVLQLKNHLPKAHFKGCNSGVKSDLLSYIF